MKHRKSEEGFTLVEIALALLVAALGVMGVFALVPQAMDTSRRSVDSTEISAFANFVFDSLQVHATDPDFLWTQFADNQSAVNPYVSHALIAADTTQEVVRAQGSDVVNLYQWTPSYYGGEGGGATVGTALYVTNYATAAFTYSLDLGVVAGNLRYARLEVWPGNKVAVLQVPGNEVYGSSVFYREYLPIR